MFAVEVCEPEPYRGIPKFRNTALKSKLPWKRNYETSVAKNDAIFTKAGNKKTPAHL